MKFSKLTCGILVGGIALGLLAVAGCADYPFDEGTFGQDQMKKHYENGEMNEYEYQSGVRAFNPGGTSTDISPGGTTLPPASDNTPAPQATDATATPDSAPPTSNKLY